MNLICRWRGHKWFPDEGRREFIPVRDVCLRCRGVRTLMPWGQCLGRHDIADHYRRGDGITPQATADCPGPR